MLKFENSQNFIKKQTCRGLIILLGIFSGCAINLSNGNLSQDSKPISNIFGANDSEYKKDQIEVPEDTETLYLFIRGELALKQDDFREALEYFELARKKSKVISPTIEKRIAQLYIREGRLEDALKASELMESAGGEINDSLKLKAGILSALGRVDESILVYKKLVETASSGEEEPYLLLSGIYIQNSRFNEAISVLENLSHKEPNSFLALYYLAKLHASLKNYDKSIEYYKKTLDINSSAEQVSLEYVKVLVLGKRVQEAIKECQKLVNQNPDNVKAREFLSELLLGEKKIELAINEFEEAKKSGKSSLELQFKVALVKLQQRDFKGAESEFNLILTQRPDYDEARYYLATAYASQDKIDAAVEQLLLIPAKNDLYKKARGFATFLLRQEKDYERAISYIKEALKSYPEDIEILSYKASVEHESGDLVNAVETLRKIAMLEPEQEQHLYNFAIALDEIKKRDEAIEVIEKVIKINPNHANALNFLGYSFAEQGVNLLRAEDLVNRALEIEKDNGFFLDSLGWIYFKNGQYEKALIALEKSVQITNSDPVIVVHLAQVYLKLGNVSRGKELLEQVLDKISKDKSSNLVDLKKEIENLLKEIN